MLAKSDRLRLQAGATASAHGEESQGFILLLWRGQLIWFLLLHGWLGRLCH